MQGGIFNTPPGETGASSASAAVRYRPGVLTASVISGLLTAGLFAVVALAATRGSVLVAAAAAPVLLLTVVDASMSAYRLRRHERWTRERRGPRVGERGNILDRPIEARTRLTDRIARERRAASRENFDSTVRHQPLPPANVQITVDNRVTNGPPRVREDAGAYLSTVRRNYCKSDGCAISGTERWFGQSHDDAAVCQTTGKCTTNGHDYDAADDGDPERFESTRYYGVRLTDGTFGYLSEVWIAAARRAGMGHPLRSASASRRYARIPLWGILLRLDLFPFVAKRRRPTDSYDQLCRPITGGEEDVLLDLLAPRELVAQLRDRYRLTEKDIATATGATIRTVRRWRKEPGNQRVSPYDEAIEHLAAVTDIVSARYQPDRVRVWLRGTSPFLQGRRPLVVLGEGDYETVRVAAQRTANGEAPPSPFDTGRSETERTPTPDGDDGTRRPEPNAPGNGHSTRERRESLTSA